MSTGLFAVEKTIKSSDSTELDPPSDVLDYRGRHSEQQVSSYNFTSNQQPFFSSKLAIAGPSTLGKA